MLEVPPGTINSVFRIYAELRIIEGLSIYAWKKFGDCSPKSKTNTLSIPLPDVSIIPFYYGNMTILFIELLGIVYSGAIGASDNHTLSPRNVETPTDTCCAKWDANSGRTSPYHQWPPSQDHWPQSQEGSVPAAYPVGLAMHRPWFELWLTTSQRSWG